MQVRLGLVRVNDGQSNEILHDEAQALREGSGVLMANRKLFMNADWQDDDGVGVPEDEKPLPEEITWTCQGGGEVIVFKGDSVHSEVNGRAWDLADQGLAKLKRSAGHSVILKWKGQGPGVGPASVMVEGLGVNAVFSFTAD